MVDDINRARTALGDLLSSAGLPLDGRTVSITGHDASIASPHRLATGMGVAVAAQAAAISEIWRRRSGHSQRVRVDLQDAADALNSADHLRIHGYPCTIRFVHTEPGNGFWRAGCGRWIYMAHGSPRLRNSLLEMLDCANAKPAIARAVAAREAAALEAQAQMMGLPLVVVRDRDAWRAHPHGQALAARAVIALERIGPGVPRPFVAAARPLSDIRVLECTHVLAGPGVGRCLAEQGADVLRIAPPRTSDPVNFQIDTGFGKRSAFLDLDTAQGQSHLGALAEQADVFVQSLRPGALARRGLDPVTLARNHPGLISVSISCYGMADGPWSNHVGYDPIAQSATGIAVTEGGADAPRVVPCTLLADHLTGCLGAFGALAGLLRRADEGGSWHVRVSLAQTCTWVQDLGLRSAHEVAQSARSHPPRVSEMDSPFGTLRYLEPAARYDITPARWERPPQPLGASPAEWLSRPARHTH